jgi:pimeloyl-ACP methyl ester carboxylesterase
MNRSPLDAIISPIAIGTHFDDAAAISAVLSSLADGGHDIVIIMHSYGGIPGTQAVAGLSKTSRLAEGKKGGVIALVYLCAFLLQKGESLVSFEGGLNPSYTVIDDHVLPPPLEFCYSDLPAEEAAAWYAMLKP